MQRPIPGTSWTGCGRNSTFAWPTLERAVVEPDARAVLVRFDSEVRHYEVLAEPAAQGDARG